MLGLFLRENYVSHSCQRRCQDGQWVAGGLPVGGRWIAGGMADGLHISPTRWVDPVSEHQPARNSSQPNYSAQSRLWPDSVQTQAPASIFSATQLPSHPGDPSHQLTLSVDLCGSPWTVVRFRRDSGIRVENPSESAASTMQPASGLDLGGKSLPRGAAQTHAGTSSHTSLTTSRSHGLTGHKFAQSRATHEVGETEQPNRRETQQRGRRDQPEISQISKPSATAKFKSQ